MAVYRNRARSFLFLLSIFVAVYGQTVQNAKDLRTKLFVTNSYDFRIRPIANQANTLNVSVQFFLLNVNDLNEVEETLKTTGYIYATWSDSELTWTPATYGGLTSAFFPQDEVWKPDIALKNSYSDYKELGATGLNVEVSNDGLVEWYPFQVLTSTCSVDIRYYPFDVQHCSLKFVAWSYGKDEVYLRSSNGIDLSDYEDNPLWDVLETSYSEEAIGEDALVTFSIKLKRKSLYAMVSVVFPIIVLTVLNLFVFVLPCESGEKSGYAVTVFLTFAVFLTIIESTMPENSTSVPVFSVYVIIMTTQSTIITTIALAMVRCSTFDDSIAIPKWVITLARIGQFKTCRNRKKENKVNDTDVEETNTPRKTGLSLELEVKEIRYTWKHIVNGLDAFCFLVFTCLSVLVTTLCLAISAGSAASQ